ncbi:peptidoglycan recognition protein family protein [Microbacterium sp. No. 7]|uniref:peptidoglycan recognition protein family protein n=1 Tax=Microbacterium sp. No. 7 TaxID=1714373 RepID=UPI0006ED1CFC|nr:N-acetylmuramoyl-L-alanine amidase [Microbacterium sp. No. 7]ALJ19572.1 hypothetical protein AOA12_06475 [Microbacterium sp. No. 7]
MTFSHLTTRTSGNAGQHSSRSGRKIRGWIIHHAATASLDVVLRMMSTGSRQVSSNYVVEDGQRIGVVPEELRAWTSSSPRGDGENLTVEIVNDRIGSSSMDWTISEESYVSTAMLIAETSIRYDFEVSRETIIGHRDVLTKYDEGYATACPSGVNLDKLIRLANAFRDEMLTPIVIKPKEITMKHYQRLDATARATGRELKPGEGFYLHTDTGQATDKASNIVGGDGAYVITAHVYAEGTPGDIVDVKLVWQDTKADNVKNSPHYVERIEIGQDGTARRSVTFQRGVDRGFAVYARLDANRSNKGEAVRVTMLDTDAALFRAA